MILYLIGKVDFPLSNSQVSEFIIEKGYTNYFNVQRAFHELEEEEMLRIKTIRNMSHYSLTEEGKEAIDMFKKAVEYNPNYALAHFNLARSIAITGEKIEAAKLYQIAQDVNKITNEIDPQDITDKINALFD